MIEADDDSGASEFDKEFLATANDLRVTPTKLIPELEKLVKDFGGTMGHYIMMNGVKTKMMSNEGDVPVRELIEFLKVQKPLKPLKLVKDLKEYACKHVED